MLPNLNSFLDNLISRPLKDRIFVGFSANFEHSVHNVKLAGTFGVFKCFGKKLKSLNSILKVRSELSFDLCRNFCQKYGKLCKKSLNFSGHFGRFS